MTARRVLASVAALSALATPLRAEVCDRIAPGWDPVAGRVTAMDELLGFIGSPAGALLIGLGVIAVMRPWRWPVVGVILVALVLTQWWVGLQAGIFGDGIFGAGIVEGCVGHPAAKIAFATGFALAVFLWTERRRKKFRPE